MLEVVKSCADLCSCSSHPRSSTTSRRSVALALAPPCSCSLSPLQQMGKPTSDEQKKAEVRSLSSLPRSTLTPRPRRCSRSSRSVPRALSQATGSRPRAGSTSRNGLLQDNVHLKVSISSHPSSHPLCSRRRSVHRLCCCTINILSIYTQPPSTPSPPFHPKNKPMIQHLIRRRPLPRIHL